LCLGSVSAIRSNGRNITNDYAACGDECYFNTRCNDACRPTNDATKDVTKNLFRGVFLPSFSYLTFLSSTFLPFPVSFARREVARQIHLGRVELPSGKGVKNDICITTRHFPLALNAFAPGPGRKHDVWRIKSPGSVSCVCVFHTTFTALPIRVHSENDSRMYF